MTKEIKITAVAYEDYTDYSFIPPANFYMMGFDEKGNQVYYFIHTSSRSVAQGWIDDKHGKGKYTVKASKISKTKSKLESGGFSCTGRQFTKGQKR